VFVVARLPEAMEGFGPARGRCFFKSPASLGFGRVDLLDSPRRGKADAGY